MSKIEIISTISYRSLMNKSKSELAQMVLDYCDIQENIRESAMQELAQEAVTLSAKNYVQGIQGIIDLQPFVLQFVNIALAKLSKPKNQP